MAQQNYSNHSRYYAPHHFIFYPLITAATAFCIVRGIKDSELSLIWFTLTFFAVLIGWLSFMLRQHYALTLQNRLVVTELCYRYFAISGERLESFGFSDSQLFALRFASDEELVNLVHRCAEENLSADKIKRSITNWKADDRRV